VIWQYDWSRMMATLDRMSTGRAGDIIRCYSSSRIWDTLNRMSSSRKNAIVKYLGISPAIKIPALPAPSLPPADPRKWF
ncbi:MAG TPA: hypothetical protein PLR25_21915, partial [Planctomycetaceae bacterium]|nr:hypothetical protein [Planctomycetaceae bacterium]